jgi:hypothetical protein
MKDYIEIGSSPCDEDCAQVGEADYERKARTDCTLYIGAIRKKLGKEPQGARLAIKKFAHDFGTYMEVVCHYDDNFQKAEEYAFKCESEAPTTWKEVGMEKDNGIVSI